MAYPSPTLFPGVAEVAPPVGAWISPTGHVVNAADGLTPAVGTEYAMLLNLPAVTIDAIGSRVWTGQTSLVGRVGIYADAGGVPSATVLHDLGTVDLTANGARSTVLGTAVSLTAGWYWVSMVQQVGATAASFLKAGSPRYWLPYQDATFCQLPLVGYTRTGITGALATHNGTAWSGRVHGAIASGVTGEAKLPVLMLRRSA